MARDLFEFELGAKITDVNSDDGVSILQGTAVPDGVSNKQDEAAIGSIYLRRGTGELYQKKANAGAPADWELQGGATIGTWRPEKVRAVTGDTGVTSGVPRNLTTTPFSDDEGTLLTAADFAVDEYAIIDDVLYRVSAVSAPNVTFTTTGVTPMAEGDTFIGINYLPDSPGDQEGQAIVTFNGTNHVKIADIDWNFADGISLAAGYSAASGDVTSADTVQSALEKIDGNNDAQDTLLGTAQGDTDLGTFSGATIPDNTSVKGALQALETAHEEVDQNVDDLITLSGMPENSTDLGTFTGSIISDNQTVKGALQELETYNEGQDVIINEIDQNVDDLIALSGVPENSTNLGAFTGYGSIFFTATETVKSAFQKVVDFIGGLRNIEVTGITTQVAVDSVPVATVGACKWVIYAFEEATPANVRMIEVNALNNGTSSIENTVNKLKIGSFNLEVDTDVSGGNMRLLVQSSTAGVTVRVRRVEVVAP